MSEEAEIKENRDYEANVGASSFYQHINNGGISMTIDRATTRDREGNPFHVGAKLHISGTNMGVMLGAMKVPLTPEDLILMGQWLIQEGEAAKEWFRDDIGVEYSVEIEGHREWAINKVRRRGSGSEGSAGGQSFAADEMDGDTDEAAQ